MLEELVEKCHPIIDVGTSIGTLGLTIDEIKAILDPKEEFQQMTMWEGEE